MSHPELVSCPEKPRSDKGRLGEDAGPLRLSWPGGAQLIRRPRSQGRTACSAGCHPTTTTASQPLKDPAHPPLPSPLSLRGSERDRKSVRERGVLPSPPPCRYAVEEQEQTQGRLMLAPE